MKLFALTEYGRYCGYGHLYRVKALVKALEHRGAEVVLTAHRVDALEEVESYRKRAQELLPLVFQYDAVIVDSYLLERDFFEALPREKLIVIDDNARLHYQARLLINPNIYAPELFYGDGFAEQLLLGGTYSLLREELFAGKRPLFQIAQEIKRVLVSLGGGGSQEILENIISFLLFQKKEVKVIVPQEMGTLPGDVEVLSVLDASQMAECYMQSDVVIAGGGQSLNEIAALGGVAVPILLAENQHRNVEGFLQLGWIPGVVVPGVDMGVQIQKYMGQIGEAKKRRQLSEMGPQLVHPGGANKCADVIINTILLKG